MELVSARRLQQQQQLRRQRRRHPSCEQNIKYMLESLTVSQQLETIHLHEVLNIA